VAIIVLIAGTIPFEANPLRKKVPARAEKPLRDTFWYRLSRTVQGRPWTFAIGGTLFLLLLAAPVLALRLGFSDEGNFPETSTTRKAYDLVAEGFGPGANGPLVVATRISGPEDLASLNALSEALNADDRVAVVQAQKQNPRTKRRRPGPHTQEQCQREVAGQPEQRRLPPDRPA